MFHLFEIDQYKIHKKYVQEKAKIGLAQLENGSLYRHTLIPRIVVQVGNYKFIS